MRMDRRIVLGGMLVWVVWAGGGGGGALAVGAKPGVRGFWLRHSPTVTVTPDHDTTATQGDPPALLRGGGAPGMKAKKAMLVTD